MVAGHLREQNGIYQIILSWKDYSGKRKTKSISTGLPVKGNKKRAEAMLMKVRREFDPEIFTGNANMPLAAYFEKWLRDRATALNPERYAQYAYCMKSSIMPYFIQKPIALSKLTATDLEVFLEYLRVEQKLTAKILLQVHEVLIIALGYGIELRWITNNPAEGINPCEKEPQLTFTVFLEDWLNMMQTSVKRSTFAGYKKNIVGKVIPYFNEHHPGLKLTDLNAKHIQNFYTYLLLERRLTANTVKHYHANIHKALKYAYSTDLILSNPADKVELPKVEKYIGNYYNAAQLEQVFAIFKGDPAEFGVVSAAFYGLRRSEIVGLKWDAVDFERKTITIRHTVTEVNIDGKMERVHADSTKTKSSYRTLPLVEPFEQRLRQMKAEQEQNRKLCGNCYCQDYLDYIYVNELGELIKPDYLSYHFPAVLKKHNMPRIRFHDLRHSCASLLFSQGVSLKEIQAWLGHSTIGTTANIYTHLDENSKLTSANAIIGILSS